MPDDAPRAAPLCSVPALLAWTPASRPDDAFCRASVPLRHRPAPPGSSSTTSRVLAAHDLAGGYGPDGRPQGAGQPPAPARLSYRFTHAASVDALVYFSHARVTIPPPSWTDTAHEGGALSLGTLIFEHADGAAEVGALAAGGQAAADAASSALAALAAWFGFDGWLVNVEAPVDGGAAAAGVATFAASLDSAMQGAVGPSALVIWYDALSAVDGAIAWRNRLCPVHNVPFLRACGGGLWANYGWGMGDLEGSAAAARAAGRPVRDVWMGADAWGRGSHGGGGPAGVATAAAHASAAGASLAVFAPAWAWEGPHAGEGGEEEGARWRVRDAALWAGVGQACGGARPCPMAPVPDGTAAWATAFSTGAGRAWWAAGVAARFAFGGGAGGHRHGPAAGWFHAGAVDALPPPALQAGWAAGGARLEAGAGGGRVGVRVCGLEAGVIAPDPAGCGRDAEAGWGAVGGGSASPSSPSSFCPGAYEGGSCLAVRGSAGAGVLVHALPPFATVAVPPPPPPPPPGGGGGGGGSGGGGGQWVSLRATAAWAPGTAAPGVVVHALPSGTAVCALAFGGGGRDDPPGSWVTGASLPAPLPAGTTALALCLVVEGAGGAPCPSPRAGAAGQGAGAAPVDARLGAVSLRAGPGRPPACAPPTLAEIYPASPAATGVRRGEGGGGAVVHWREAGRAGTVRWWEVWRARRGAGEDGPPVLLGLTRAPMWRGAREGEEVDLRARFVDGSVEGRGRCGEMR